jgi:hypothetical protein
LLSLSGKAIVRHERRGVRAERASHQLKAKAVVAAAEEEDETEDCGASVCSRQTVQSNVSLRIVEHRFRAYALTKKNPSRHPPGERWTQRLFKKPWMTTYRGNTS